MTQKLQLPSTVSRMPRRSWWSSLRPNARTLHPSTEPGAPSPPTPVGGRRAALGGVLACLVVAGIMGRHTLAKLARPRPTPHVVSGRAGLRRTPSGADERWSQPSVTVTLDPTLAGATPTARDAVASAFGTWVSSGASLPQLSFDVAAAPGQAAEDGVNRLLLGPITLSGHEDDLAITISYADESSGTVLEADTIFNEKYSWAAMGEAAGDDRDGPGCGGRYDLQNVATHEAGHFFGLGEDYEDDATTMYVSSRPCQTSKRTLSKPDVAVVSTLYATSLAQAVGCGARVAPGGGTDGGALAAIGIVACAAARRRRRR